MHVIAQDVVREECGRGRPEVLAGAEWLELDVVHLTELADYVEREGRDDEERLRGLRRLLARMDEEGARRHVPRHIDLGPRLLFFRRMGVSDPYEQVPTPAVLRGLIRRHDARLWDVWEGEVCAAHVMWMHLRELLEERVEGLQEGLALLGRDVVCNQADGVQTVAVEVPHFDLQTDDMTLDIICRGLVAGGYLHPETREEAFRYVCKGSGKRQKGPLVWTGKKNEFKLMVKTLFAGQPRMWERALGCFVHVSGPFGEHVRNAHPPLGDDSERLAKRLAGVG